ncbi:DUF305 domain-containing protein [uncultured Jatrophihabitans sp.]|uniref:DUF305 domain-containing protein n=1 Tax=uncultured Jatrophihabitans sp. TaxID=1610747 RepID=UPI0035C9DD57
MPRRSAAALVAAVVTVGLLGACSSDPKPNDADRTFLSDMIPHHERAIAVAELGVSRASDPRVRAFARRIVREQTPELSRMRTQAEGTTVDTAAGATMALHRITDADVAQLKSLSGDAFDRRFLALHIASEQGAAQMARTELADGRAAQRKKVAKGIAGAPTSEIPELQALLGALS